MALIGGRIPHVEPRRWGGGYGGSSEATGQVDVKNVSVLLNT